MSVILHLDMDCFFAQVEELRYPEIRGKPVIVGADPRRGRGRGVVSTANYEARKFGVHSAMPISRAFFACPDAVFLPVDFRHYGAVSRRIMNLASCFSAKAQPVSVDELYLDLSGRSFLEAEALGRQLKARILEEEGLTCSVGIAWNKALAKLATSLKKPDGLTVLRPSELEARVWPLSVDTLSGIGKKTAARLEQVGVRTIGDLAKTPVRTLVEHLGVSGFYFRDLAWGKSGAELSEAWRAKSVSREHTFYQDTANAVDVVQTVYGLSERVLRDVKNEGVFFKTVGVKLRFSDFTTLVRSKTVRLSQSLDIVTSTAKSLLLPLLAGKKVRLVGVRVSGFVDAQGQKTLG
ncbi:DNA polymerase IV [Candidatus Micrarchaeota archaeon]|nr:DNA polymerase IV [Candidatus Micrarchaeota archaeon]